MEIGNKIRELREQLGMTITELAERAHVTPSLISQIERNHANPSLSTLKKVADVLQTPLAFLFSEDIPSVPVVRKNARKTMVVGPNHDITEEFLSPDSDRAIEFLLITYEVGANSDGFLSHKGEECGLILEGTLELTIGTEIYVLDEGDSIYFNSEIPHLFRNIGDKKLKMVWAITPPSW